MVCSVCHYLLWSLLMLHSSLQLDIGKNCTADTHISNFFISDNCNERLGLETKNQSTVLISASSSYDNLSVGPQHARWGKSKNNKIMIFLIISDFTMMTKEGPGVLCSQSVLTNLTNGWV